MASDVIQGTFATSEAKNITGSTRFEKNLIPYRFF